MSPQGSVEFRITGGCQLKNDTFEDTQNSSWGVLNATLLMQSRNIRVSGTWPMASCHCIVPGMTFTAQLHDQEGRTIKKATFIQSTDPVGAIVIQCMLRCKELLATPSKIRTFQKTIGVVYAHVHHSGTALYNALEAVSEKKQTNDHLNLEPKDANLCVGIFTMRKKLIDLGMRFNQIPTKALDYLDKHTATDLLENPYCLSEMVVPAANMLIVADQIAMEHNVATDDPRRVNAHIKRACIDIRAEDGSFWRTGPSIVRAVEQFHAKKCNMVWNFEYGAVQTAIQDAGKDDSILVCDKEGVNADEAELKKVALYALKTHSEQEEQLANTFAKIKTHATQFVHDGALLRNLEMMEAVQEGGAVPDSTPPGMKKVIHDYCNLDATQRSIFRHLHEDHIVCLNGGPGCGKSFLLGVVVRFLSESHVDVCATAPTGKAASRLTKSIAVGGVNAHTMHTEAYRNRDDPVNGAYVIDELSMCDVQTLTLLLRERTSCIHKLLVCGDVNQLASIGPGAALRDIVESGAVSTVTLTKIHRQERGGLDIAKTAPYIVDGTLAPENRGKVGADGLNIKIVNGSDGDCQTAINCALEHHRNKESTLFLVTTNAVREKANVAMQRALNPPRNGVKEAPSNKNPKVIWREGDLIVNLKNISIGDDDRLANGEQGKLVRVDKENGTFHVAYPVGVDEAHEQSYPVNDLDAATHAWALTVWKSQGSEADRVVCYMPNDNANSRELLNTAVTRARVGVTVFITQNVLMSCLMNSTLETRKTRLGQRLAEAMSRASKKRKADSDPM